MRNLGLWFKNRIEWLESSDWWIKISPLFIGGLITMYWICDIRPNQSWFKII